MTNEELTAYNSSAGVTTPTVTSSFTYDDEGRMTGVTYPGYTGVNPASYTYTFDAMGRPSAMSSVASAAA
jgi:YD repeat-containing protein